MPDERISNAVDDGAVLARGELLWRVLGVVGCSNLLIDLPHSGRSDAGLQRHGRRPANAPQLGCEEDQLLGIRRGTDGLNSPRQGHQPAAALDRADGHCSPSFAQVRRQSRTDVADFLLTFKAKGLVPFPVTRPLTCTFSGSGGRI